jgi:catechol 2,3-dioxygenase-like lactoylglutathione lyase family enzyme
MRVQLDHTIVPVTNTEAGAEFLGRILGVEPSPQWGPFLPLVLWNGVSLDFVDADEVPSQHYAFLVSEYDFDPIFERIRAAGLSYYADPFHRQPGEINHLYGGRGVYFDDPDGHLMEVITQTYGPVPEG